jgi:hypothetical protein
MPLALKQKREGLMAMRLAILVLISAPCCARADTTAATSCADGLSADAKAIYAAATPGIKTADDPRAFVKSKVVALVESGAIGRFSAKSNAQAAGDCLKMLR